MRLKKAIYCNRTSAQCTFSLLLVKRDHFVSCVFVCLFISAIDWFLFYSIKIFFRRHMNINARYNFGKQGSNNAIELFGFFKFVWMSLWLCVSHAFDATPFVRPPKNIIYDELEKCYRYFGAMMILAQNSIQIDDLTVDKLLGWFSCDWNYYNLLTNFTHCHF